ncbi:hypothetical protein RRSWK_01102 [Rhodopirellula sp. SWK7]|nr:hypothetical protein RRSWK_01102 [Rhodopirellula sp. SWK7]
MNWVGWRDNLTRWFWREIFYTWQCMFRYNRVVGGGLPCPVIANPRACYPPPEFQTNR